MLSLFEQMSSVVLFRWFPGLIFIRDIKTTIENCNSINSITTASFLIVQAGEAGPAPASRPRSCKSPLVNPLAVDGRHSALSLEDHVPPASSSSAELLSHVHSLTHYSMGSLIHLALRLQRRRSPLVSRPSPKLSCRQSYPSLGRWPMSITKGTKTLRALKCIK